MRVCWLQGVLTTRCVNCKVCRLYPLPCPLPYLAKALASASCSARDQCTRMLSPKASEPSCDSASLVRYWQSCSTCRMRQGVRAGIDNEGVEWSRVLMYLGGEG